MRRHEPLMAWNYPRFREWFQPEHNPGVDPTKLRKYDRETRLVHVHENGYVQRTSCYNLFYNDAWDNNGEKRITPKKKHRKGLRYTPFKKKYCSEVPEFRQFFQKKYNPGIDLRELRVTDNKTRLTHVDEYGRVRHVTPNYLSASQKWELAPPGSPRALRRNVFKQETGTRFNALEADPELECFVISEAVYEKLKNCLGKDDFYFACPYCGYEFHKKVEDMVGVSPKCPNCKDMGFFQENSEEGADGGYLVRR